VLTKDINAESLLKETHIMVIGDFSCQGILHWPHHNSSNRVSQRSRFSSPRRRTWIKWFRHVYDCPLPL